MVIKMNHPEQMIPHPEQMIPCYSMRRKVQKFVQIREFLLKSKRHFDKMAPLMGQYHSSLKIVVNYSIIERNASEYVHFI